VKKFLGACRGERRANKTFCIDGLKGILLCSSSRLNLQLRDGSLDLIYTKASIFGREDGVFFFLLFVLLSFVACSFGICHLLSMFDQGDWACNSCP